MDPQTNKQNVDPEVARVSLQWRLTRGLLTRVGLLVIVICLSIYFATSAALQRAFDETLIAKSEALITASEIDEEGFEIDLVIQEFADFDTIGSDLFEMYRSDGTAFARSPSLHGMSFPEKLRSGTLFRLPGPDLRDFRMPDGRHLRICARWFTPQDDHQGEYAAAGTFADSLLIVAMDRRALDQTLRLLALVLLAVGSATLILLVPIVARTLRIGLSPLEEVNARLRGWGTKPTANRLDAVFDTALPDELLPLATALEDAIGRVQQSMDRERRFSANAAHELRTPLAELRAVAEIGARWEDEATPERFAELVAVCDRANRLLDQLTDLARSEHGTTVDLETFDQADALDAICDAVQARATARDITFDVSEDAPTIETDSALWHAIAGNLIGNAVDHGAPSSTIFVRASHDVLEVRNAAPNLATDDVPHLFERFWRASGSGHSDTHSGLGLSIVKACVTRLGGTVAATLQDDVLVVTVRWSADEAARVI